MRIAFSFFLTLFFASQTMAQGIDFFHGTWKEALAESKKTGKPIFVDAYAKWCGPCKRMAKTTFMDKKAGDFFNEKFVNMKIDAEESEGRKFRQKYPVSAFPTLFFIDESGEVLHKVVGGQNTKGLIQNGELALRKVDYSREYAKRYEEGERDPQFLFDYVASLNKSNKPSLKVSNEYLRTQKDLTTEFNLRFIHEAAVEADSRIFNLLIEHQTAIGQLVGLPALQERILLACENTANKAIEFEFEELLMEAKAKMQKNYPAKAGAFAANADMRYYKKMNNAEKYGKACADYATHVANGDATKLDQLAKDLAMNFSEHEACMKMAEKFSKTAASKSKDYSHHLNYAIILDKNGKTKQAKKAAKSALQLAKANGGQAEKMVQNFIQSLDS
ncbi:MAG: thioredoxin family protein [Bacteroidota bacterium]